MAAVFRPLTPGWVRGEARRVAAALCGSCGFGLLGALPGGGVMLACGARQEQRWQQGGCDQRGGGPEGGADGGCERWRRVCVLFGGERCQRLDALRVAGEVCCDRVLQDDREQSGADGPGDALDGVERAGRPWR